MNLYEIDNRISEAFEAAVDQDTGEIVDDQAYEALNGLQMDRKQKIEGILLWIKDLSAHADDIKKEKNTLAQRQKAAENKAESLKKYVASVLSGEKFSTSRVAVSIYIPLWHLLIACKANSGTDQYVIYIPLWHLLICKLYDCCSSNIFSISG